MPTGRSPSNGTDVAAPDAPRAIPDYETAIASLRRRLGGEDAPPAAAAELPPDEPESALQPSPPRSRPRSAARVRLVAGIAALVLAAAGVTTAIRSVGSREGRGAPSPERLAGAGRHEQPGSASPSARLASAASPATSTPAASQATSASAASPATSAPVVESPPTPAAAPSPTAAAPVPDEASAGSTASLDAAERRALRRRLMRACDEERYADALQPGRRLREGAALDWGAMLCLASAFRNTGRGGEARALYRAFIAQYPHNRHVKDAREALAELDHAEAGAPSAAAPVGGVGAP